MCGITTVTGTAGQTCTLTAFNGPGGSGAEAIISLSGTNAIEQFSPLLFTNPGSGYTGVSTSATAGNGTASCSGTASVTTESLGGIGIHLMSAESDTVSGVYFENGGAYAGQTAIVMDHTVRSLIETTHHSGNAGGISFNSDSADNVVMMPSLNGATLAFDGTDGRNWARLNYSDAANAIDPQGCNNSDFLEWAENGHKEGCPGYPQWIANNGYFLGYQIVDSNGNLQVVTTAGTSGSGAAPTWNTSGTTSDGGVAWNWNGAAPINQTTIIGRYGDNGFTSPGGGTFGGPVSTPSSYSGVAEAIYNPAAPFGSEMTTNPGMTGGGSPWTVNGGNVATCTLAGGSGVSASGGGPDCRVDQAVSAMVIAPQSNLYYRLTITVSGITGTLTGAQVCLGGTGPSSGYLVVAQVCDPNLVSGSANTIYVTSNYGAITDLAVIAKLANGSDSATFTYSLKQSTQACGVGGGGVNCTGAIAAGSMSAGGDPVMANPMTTAGDVVIGGTVAGGVATPTRLAGGALDTLLQGGGLGSAPSFVALANCTAAGGVLRYSASSHTWSCHILASADIPNNAANTSGVAQYAQGFQTTTFSALGIVPSAGMAYYCTDCTTAATCAGSGTGHAAVSNGSIWTCQ